MKKKIYILLSIFIFSVIFLSCESKTNNNSKNNNWSKIEIRNEIIDKKPQKVISLSPGLTETIFALGISENLVGRSNYCDYPVEANSLPIVGTSQILDFQQIISLEPDYILTQNSLSQFDIERLSKNNIKIINIPKAHDVDELLKIYNDLFLFFEGEELGKEKSEIYCNKFLDDLNDITDISNDIDLSVLYLVGFENTAATPDTFEGNLMSLIGLNNIADKYVNWECDFNDLDKNQPDIIIITNSIVNEYIQSNEILSQLDAVKNNNVYIINGIALERQSPRILLEIKSVISTINTLNSN